jgi:hypothetical protein
MKRVRLIATTLALAVLAVLATGVAAQQTNTSERTFLTFSAPVQMPGVTLQAGTYVFKLADTPSRNVVQVWTEDEKEMLGHWLFVQAERPEVSEENVVMFKETPAGTTPAVQYWYFPGERIGKEFVYPREQATQIAAATGSRVLASEGDAGEVTSIDAQGNVSAWQKEESGVSADAQSVQGAPVAPQSSADSTLNNAPAAAQPSAPAGSLAGNRGAAADTRDEASAQARVQEQPEPEPAPAPAPSEQPRGVGTSGAQAESQSARADELPRTASPLALSGIIGLLSLAGAMGVRAMRR